ADIDCAVASTGKELFTARLRKPDGFRGSPIFADDRGGAIKDYIVQDLQDAPCVIVPDNIGDSSGRVFKMRITDFTRCGVLKRNGFVHVRIWFPQLPGVVMLSDQEVIIMCKPPAATIVQSKTAGFAGSIPSGARVSGVVEESPGRLEYEVALYRETNLPIAAGRSSPGSGTFITGSDSQELPVDQAVPIGTRLQLRARINPDSAWQHAKLMEVSVSPDAKDPVAEGSVSLVKAGCRNPDLASIIPKQPYRYKEQNNEVVLDFEAFLLSNMGDRNTLWLHTQIKACMDAADCQPEFCMDVYQPSGFGRKRRSTLGNGPTLQTLEMSTAHNSTAVEYSSPLAQHWKTVSNQALHVVSEANGSIGDGTNDLASLGLELSRKHSSPIPIPPETVVRSFDNGNVHKEEIGSIDNYLLKTTPVSSTTSEFHPKAASKKPIVINKKFSQVNSKEVDEASSTKFGDNIGFSVVMPADYYRKTDILSTTQECRGWATATLIAVIGAAITGILTCILSYKLQKASKGKADPLFSIHSRVQTPITVRTPKESISSQPGISKMSGHAHHHHHHHHKEYARDSSVYRS
ncbi:1-deoxy-D-xylulose-5-phosphate synthase, partial [Orchesella cincta]